MSGRQGFDVFSVFFFNAERRVEPPESSSHHRVAR